MLVSAVQRCDSFIYIHFFIFFAIIYYKILNIFPVLKGFPGGSEGKESTCNAEGSGDKGSIPGWEGPLKEGMATRSSVLAWRIPWTEEPGRL